MLRQIHTDLININKHQYCKHVHTVAANNLTHCERQQAYILNMLSAVNVLDAVTANIQY